MTPGKCEQCAVWLVSGECPRCRRVYDRPIVLVMDRAPTAPEPVLPQPEAAPVRALTNAFQVIREDGRFAVVVRAQLAGVLHGTVSSTARVIRLLEEIADSEAAKPRPVSDAEWARGASVSEPRA